VILVLGLAILLASGRAWAADDGNRGEMEGGRADGRAVLDREMVAVRALEKLGARIERDAERPGRPVIMVILRGERGKYCDLSVLTALPQLERLWLSHTVLTESDLKALSRLQNLRRLGLPEETATKTGVALRKARPQLEVFQSTREEERKTGVVIPPAVIP
jgi:hypothetical protein